MAGDALGVRHRRACCAVGAVLVVVACVAWLRNTPAARRTAAGGLGALMLREGRRQSLEQLLTGGAAGGGWLQARGAARRDWPGKVRALQASAWMHSRPRLEHRYRATLSDLERAARMRRASRLRIHARERALGADSMYAETMARLPGALKDHLAEQAYREIEMSLVQRAQAAEPGHILRVRGLPEQAAQLSAMITPAALGVAQQTIAALHRELASADASGVSPEVQEQGRRALRALGRQLQRTDPYALHQFANVYSVRQSMMQAPRHLTGPGSAGDAVAAVFENGLRPSGHFEDMVQPFRDFGGGRHELFGAVQQRAAQNGANLKSTGRGNEFVRNMTDGNVLSILQNVFANFLSQNQSRTFNNSQVLNGTEVVRDIASRIKEESELRNGVLDPVPGRLRPVADPSRAFEWMFGRPYAGRGRQRAVTSFIFGRQNAAANGTTPTAAQQRKATIAQMERVTADMKRMNLSDENVRISAHDIDWVFGRTKRDFITDKGPAPANATADANALKLLIDAARNITGLLNESRSMIEMAKESIMHTFVPDPQYDVKHAQQSVMSAFHPLKPTQITIQVSKKGKARILDNSGDDSAGYEEEERGQRKTGDSLTPTQLRTGFSAGSKWAQLSQSFADDTRSTGLSGGHLLTSHPKHAPSKLALSDEGGGELDEDSSKTADTTANGGQQTKTEVPAASGWRGLQNFGQWLLIALSLILLIMSCTVLGFICFGCLWAWREFKRQDRWDILFSRSSNDEKNDTKKPAGTSTGAPRRDLPSSKVSNGVGRGSGGINRRSDTQMAR